MLYTLKYLVMPVAYALCKYFLKLILVTMHMPNVMTVCNRIYFVPQNGKTNEWSVAEKLNNSSSSCHYAPFTPPHQRSISSDQPRGGHTLLHDFVISFGTVSSHGEIYNTPTSKLNPNLRTRSPRALTLCLTRWQTMTP